MYTFQKEESKNTNGIYPCNVLMISFETNSKKIDELAILKAFLLALLNEAAVPSGVLASTAPPKSKSVNALTLIFHNYRMLFKIAYRSTKCYIRILHAHSYLV